MDVSKEERDAGGWEHNEMGVCVSSKVRNEEEERGNTYSRSDKQEEKEERREVRRCHT